MFSKSENKKLCKLLKSLPFSLSLSLCWIYCNCIKFSLCLTQAVFSVCKCVSVALQWILRYDCFPARSGSTVTARVHRDSDLLISGSHMVQLTGVSLYINDQHLHHNTRECVFTSAVFKRTMWIQCLKPESAWTSARNASLYAWTRIRW